MLDFRLIHTVQGQERLRQIYNKMVLGECTEDDAQDAAGFTGDFTSHKYAA